MSTKTLLTADEYMTMPDDGYTELVRGEIVRVPPPRFRHGTACINIGFLLETWVRSTGSGAVCSNDTAVQTEYDPDTIRGADVSFYAQDRIPSDPDAVGDKPPTLCVEILSPSHRWPDVLGKIREYLDVGVDEVWIVHPDEKWVELHTPDVASKRLGMDDQIADRAALPGFAVPVSELFRGLPNNP